MSNVSEKTEPLLEKGIRHFQRLESYLFVVCLAKKLERLREKMLEKGLTN